MLRDLTLNQARLKGLGRRQLFIYDKDGQSYIEDRLEGLSWGLAKGHVIIKHSASGQQHI